MTALAVAVKATRFLLSRSSCRRGRAYSRAPLMELKGSTGMEMGMTKLSHLQGDYRPRRACSDELPWKELTRVCFLLHGLSSLLCFPGELEL